MKLRSIGLALGLAGLGIAANSMSARALDFSFSFTVNNINGTSISPSSDTITGEIVGLSNNTTSSATDIIITSDPALGIASGTELDNASGTFTVASGQITAFNGISYTDSTSDQIQFNDKSLGTYYNEIQTATGYASKSSSSAFSVGSYNFTLVPWEFNPGEMVGLGVPLMMGLGVLKKKLALR
jgi:hypothetical protein